MTSRSRARTPRVAQRREAIKPRRLPRACAPPSPLWLHSASASPGFEIGTISIPAWVLAVASHANASATNQVDGRALVISLFKTEGHALVRLARLFVDDRNAAEDLVQEAFIRLARSTHRINDLDRAPAYLRSIVLNLARDHNRRGLVSLRHSLPFDDARAATEDIIDLTDDQSDLIDALRELPKRQRDCLVLRYYEDLSVDEIAAALNISRNSVKTHLTRGMAGLRVAFDAIRSDEFEQPQ